MSDEYVRKEKAGGQQYEEALPMRKGKLNMETEQDIDVILKMFGGYYKKGIISRKPYGTFSGKEIEEAKCDIFQKLY